ncbi:MAG: DUF1800 domain-containing protein [Acidobacteria bacterium]|nr:DUF1800 domain-containing protein [Acidobacteriota bacterium]
MKRVAQILPLGFLLLYCTLPLVAGEARQPLSEEQQILHALDRLGYGPRPGDVEKVKKIGLRAYIEQQLHPESIPDAVADRKLAEFKSLALGNLEELDKAYPIVAPEGLERRGKAIRLEPGEKAFPPFVPKGARAMPSAPDDLGKGEEDARAFRQMTRTQKPGEYELGKAQAIRGVYSERQLLEMMVGFWVNHFFLGRASEAPQQDYDEHVIRPQALGKFEDLLKATAQHPAMLFYLDNWRSAAPLEVIQQRLNASLQPTLSGPDRRVWRQIAVSVREFKGLNENYARELMELHTLGVDGGYTQQDVIQVAKCFTGWTVTEWDENGARRPDKFIFSPLLHESGDKVVLGQTIKPGGMEEGMQVLTMLAHHPSTARFISTKLVRRFVADDPPAEIVEAGRQAFLKTGGDIREVVRAILTHPKFLAPEYYQVKFKMPLELIVSSLRAVNAEIGFPPAPRRRMGQGPSVGLGAFLQDMGQAGRRTPDGYPDYAAAWINSNALLKRMEFANALTAGQIPGVKPDLQAARQLIHKLRLPEPNAEQIERIRAQMTQAGREKKSGQEMGQASMMMDASAGRKGDAAPLASPEAIAVAYALGSPQFQKR